MSLSPHAFPGKLSVAALNRIANQRVQQEAKLAREIRDQHPEISRDDALRLAADLVSRDRGER